MTGDAVRWKRIETFDKPVDTGSWFDTDSIKSGENVIYSVSMTNNANSDANFKQSRSSSSATNSHLAVVDDQCGSPDRQRRRRNPGQLYLSSLSSFSKFLTIFLFCLSSTIKTRQLSSHLVAVSAIDKIMQFVCKSRRGPFLTSKSVFLSYLLVACALSSSFVIVSANIAADISTSRDNDAFDYLGDSSDGGSEVDRGIGHYTPTWAVHIPDGDVDGKADRVARDHGFINLGKIFDDHYHFHHNSISKRSIEASDHHQSRLENDDRVRWSKQQRIKSRKKRDFIRMRPSRTSSVSRVELNDPKWPQMWYLNRGSGLDMNVIPAWEQGITGKGVVVTILDDGLESDHPDLEHNYDPRASYDVNSHDDDPMPHYDMTDSNRHGTRCAGEVAATANNSLCSVGIAFGARVGGVRMLDGDVTDAVEARSLSLNPQHIDIYSASWGPDDDGKTVDGPGDMATRAFIEGVTKGRNGKGSIFIWASGNGGRELDNCNCDGYTNSIWTLSISSATEEGHVPWYSEKCSSTLATTYSSGAQNEKQVVTTDLHHSCTTSHTGTSASAPLAAGIVALVLEANRNLTWRDLQHIVVRTAKPGNLKDQSWTKNGVGRRVSHSFGYGLMDAAAMVKLATTWQTVPEQQRCEINAPHVEQMIPAKRYITLQLTVKHCMGVNFLEHVQAKISLTSQRRGDIVIYLQSPSGTRVTLLTSRVHDVSRSGFNEWPFMSVHTWGEAPHGNWLLEVHNEGRFLGYAVLKSWSLIFYGTAIAADKNDPIPIKPTVPPYSSQSTSLIQQSVYAPINTKYSTAVLTKPGAKTKINQSSLPNSSGGNSAGGSRKQQQNQKINHFGPVLTPPKKNSKNNKNNAQTSNNKANSKGNLSNRPSSSQQVATSQQSSKNNFYRLQTSASGGKLSSTGSARQSTTTPKPKYSNQESFHNANVASNRGSSASPSAYKPEKSRVHEKIAIKAPKQIKDNNAYGFIAATMSSTSDPMLVSPSHARFEPNLRIPKLFQQYDKIEQIFPEFHPYTGGSGGISRDHGSPTKPAPNKKQYPYYTGTGGAGQDSNSGGNRGGGRSNNSGGSRNGERGRNDAASVVVVTNPKPSRENSKKFPSTSLSSSTSSQISLNEERDRQTEEMYIPNRKNTKAQITQWDLIFHGTEKPPQPDDPIQISPGNFGSYGGEIDNNFLDSNPETMGQWRDMQQIGESHIDVQRTTNDQTSTACTNFVADQRCIECAQGTFLYKDRCWSHCPEQSYMIPEIPRNRNRNKNINDNDDDNEEFGDTLSVRSADNWTANSTDDLEFSSEDTALSGKRNIMKPIPQKRCASCHISCLLCRGPELHHCLQCHRGDHLTIVSATEAYCYPSTNGNNLSRATAQFSADETSDNDGDMLSDLHAFWSVIIPGMVLIVFTLALSVIGKQLYSYCKKSDDHAYERVAFKKETPSTASKEEIKPLTSKSRELPGPSGRETRSIIVESSSDSDDY